MRLTIGQTWSHCRRSPPSTSATPATTRPGSFSPGAAPPLSHMPDHVPSIIVASVGMKLSVDQPPSL